MLNLGGAFHDLSLPIRLGLQTLMQAFRPLLLLSFLCLSFSDSKNFILIFSDSFFWIRLLPLLYHTRCFFDSHSFLMSFFGFPWISMDLQCFSDSSQIALFSCSRSFHIFSDFQILHSLRFCVILDLQYLFSCVYFKSLRCPRASDFPVFILILFFPFLLPS